MTTYFRYFINAVIDKDDMLAQARHLLKKVKAPLIATVNSRMFSGESLLPRTFSRDSAEDDGARGRSFDGVASNHDISRKDSERPDGKLSKDRTYFQRNSNAEDKREVESDNLNMYAQTSSQISSIFLVFHDPELEIEYRSFIVQKMGGKFLTATSLVLLSTAVQAALLIYVAYSTLVSAHSANQRTRIPLSDPFSLSLSLFFLSFLFFFSFLFWMLPRL